MNNEQRDNLVKFIQFLHLSGDKSLVFQTFGEGAAKGDRGLTRVLVNPATKQLLAAIDASEQRSAGVFVQVNGGSGRGGKYIETARAAFLDLDGAPLERVQEAVKAGYPKPHMVVESSPGRYHVYWRVVDLTLENFSYVQKSIAALFDGDGVVFDHPRVMRLPGSFNFKHGDPFMVRVIHFKPDLESCTVAELLSPDVSDSLPAAPEFVQEFAQSTLAEALQVDGYTGESASDIKELKPGDRTQKIVRIAGALVAKHPALGVDEIKAMLVDEVDKRTPEGARKVSSDSWNNEIFPAVERFVERRDAEVEEIVEAQQVDTTTYGEQEFEAFQASRNTQALDMKDFSERFVMVGSDQLVFDLTKGASQRPYTTTAFKQYAQVFTTKKGVPLVTQWLKNRALRQNVDTITYKPYPHSHDQQRVKLQRIVRDQDSGQLCYNTYATPKLVPVPPTDEMAQRRAIKPFMDHMAYLFPREDKREAFIDWVAATVQRPDRRVQWAPFIISKHQGVGKGWLANLLQKLVGISNYKFITMKEIERGDFNDFLADSTLVVLDEVYAPRREDLVVKLQPMVTETAMEINRKYGTKGLTKIYANMILFSNYEDALSLYATDRRFFVHMMDDAPKDEEYYNQLWTYLESPELGCLLHWLLKRDISKFTWGRCPHIEGDESKARMLNASKNDTFVFLDSLRQLEEGPFQYDVVCKQVIMHYIKMQYVLDEVDEFDPRTLERDVKAWLRTTAQAYQRIVSIGKARHNMWYYVKSRPLRGVDSIHLKREAIRSIKDTYGEQSKIFQSINKKERRFLTGEEDGED